jgi:hypothetical protein
LLGLAQHERDAAEAKARLWKNRVDEAAAVVGTLEAEVARLREELADIAAMTNADDPASYRCDDREGCLDAVYAKAIEARDNSGQALLTQVSAGNKDGA